MINLKPTMIE